MEKWLCEKSVSKLDWLLFGYVVYLFGVGVVNFLGLVVLVIVAAYVSSFYERRYVRKQASDTLKTTREITVQKLKDAARWEHARKILPEDVIEEWQLGFEKNLCYAEEEENLRADATIDSCIARTAQLKNK